MSIFQTFVPQYHYVCHSIQILYVLSIHIERHDRFAVCSKGSAWCFYSEPFHCGPTIFCEVRAEIDDDDGDDKDGKRLFRL